MHFSAQGTFQLMFVLEVWKREGREGKKKKLKNLSFIFLTEIERKISMRTSREELIRKGVIREPDGSQNYLPVIGKLLLGESEVVCNHQQFMDLFCLTFISRIGRPAVQ